MAGKLKWVFAVIAALYAVFYWQFIAKRCAYTGDVRLDGKTVIITGGNSGIGRQTAFDFAGRGAHVILACRSLQKGQAVADDIKVATGNADVVVRRLDLASLQSVREFSDEIIKTEVRLDILVNNAGIGLGNVGLLTEDQFDLTFGTNHFGHFLLTNLLLDMLKKSAPSRVVTVSSYAHVFFPSETLEMNSGDSESTTRYPNLYDYSASKLANVLFARELARRHGDSSGVVSVSLHPGTIYTSMSEKVFSGVFSKLYYVVSPILWLLLLDEKTGAQTQIHCALHESVRELSGRYFDNCLPIEPSPLAQNDTLARELWDVSCEATGLEC